MRTERELTVLDTDRFNERIAVVEVHEGERSVVELRFQQQVAGLGWSTQRRMTIDASQVGDLRLALTLFASTNASQCRKPQVIGIEELRAG